MGRRNSEKDFISRFGEALRQARKRANMTQEMAADKANIERVYWSYIEGGKKNISVAMALRVCRAVGTTLGKVAGKAERG